MRRLARGGRIDRSQPLRFRFDGNAYEGLSGDTLASALLANGVRIVGRSPSLDRPRGVYAAGAEEPNAFVRLDIAGSSEPIRCATGVELIDGLDASGLSGKGRAPSESDPSRYDKIHAHCDVLVVGGGPGGLAAARAAGRTGARVLLAHDDFDLGGSLLGEKATIDGLPADDWINRCFSELTRLPEIRVLTRTSAFGAYDANCVFLVEQRSQQPGPAVIARQRLWQVRARHIVLATGAHERPVVFADNDRPGVMLASAARTYINRFAVAPGRRAVVFTNNDSAYAAAIDLSDAGVEVAAIVDVRPAQRPWHARARQRGIELLLGQAIVGTDGDASGVLSAVRVMAIDPHGIPTGAPHTIESDLLAISGGFNPVVHLFSQSQGRLQFDERHGRFLPDGRVRGMSVVGAANGSFDLSTALRQGHTAGAAAAALAGFGEVDLAHPPQAGEVDQEQPTRPLWCVAAVDGDWTKHFVDLQRDATVADLAQGVGAGLRSVEHLKRYTTIGTGIDQGKTSGVLSAGVSAGLLGEQIAALGTTTFRPPYTPVSFGVLAGTHVGDLYDPIRVTPIHGWHVAHGAIFENVAQWKRPWYYPQPGEDMQAAVLRECRAARGGVGVMDVSTLGKIDIQGPDAAEFLNRMYTNAHDNLALGQMRYGVMCRADGMVFDDGVVMHLADDRFLTTTTTGNAAEILEWMEEWLQTEWPELRVRLTSVTDHWATVAVVGPRARDVMGALAPDMALDPTSFPFMTLREGVVAGMPARVSRVTFSGELAYEINVPAWYGLVIWQAVMAAGEQYAITPYGTEAMHVLRAEKGYVIVGQDTDGTVSPYDLGMGWVVSRKKPDFIGRRSLARSDTARSDRKHLVGLLPLDPSELLPEGSQLILEPADGLVQAMAGHVTSSYQSAALNRTFALALLRSGRERFGSVVYASLPDRFIAATVTRPIFFDPDGLRRDG